MSSRCCFRGAVSHSKPDERRLATTSVEQAAGVTPRLSCCAARTVACRETSGRSVADDVEDFAASRKFH